MQNNPDYILELKEITQYFKGVTALRDVNFAVRRGEIHGLVGQNGAGKSTLVKIISGVLQPSQGKILIDGQEAKNITPQNSQSLYGISIVPQHVELFPYFSVAENMFINNLPLKGGLIDYKTLNAAAGEWFVKFGLDLDPAMPMEELSFVQQKVVLILKALKDQSKIIILDEPTASLHVDEIGNLFKFIKEFNEKGVTFIYISHFMEEIFQICDRVTVLRDGQIQAVEEIAALNLKTLVHRMVGQEVNGLNKEKRENAGETILAVQDFHGEKILKGVNFALQKGEILGILSNQGSGKDELVKSMFGLTKRRKGRMVFKGETLAIASPEDCFAHKICLLPDDRHRDGLFLDKTVKENISICALPKVTAGGGFINVKTEAEKARIFIERFSIKTPSTEQEVQFLSGGNQQKVLLSKVLNADPDVLVLDSPTVGVDIKARLDIHQIIKEHSDQGLSIILITSDLDEILALSDRILVLVKGAITCEIKAGDPRFNRKDIGFLMEGGEIS